MHLLCPLSLLTFPSLWAPKWHFNFCIMDLWSFPLGWPAHISILHHLLCAHSTSVPCWGVQWHLKVGTQWVNVAAPGWTEGCWIKWAEAVSLCRKQMLHFHRALSPRKASIILPAKWCRGSHSYLHLHAKRCKRVAGCVGNQRDQGSKGMTSCFKKLCSCELSSVSSRKHSLPVFSLAFETSRGFW